MANSSQFIFLFKGPFTTPSPIVSECKGGGGLVFVFGCLKVKSCVIPFWSLGDH